MPIHPTPYHGVPLTGAPIPLGDPYANMTETEQFHCRAIERDIPWVHSSHRLIVRLACMLHARMDEDKLGLTGVRSLLSLLSKLGAPTVEAGRVSLAE